MGRAGRPLGEQHGDLAGEGLRVREALGQQDDLADEGEVWHHHGHRAEEGLEVVGELRPPGVAW